MCFLESDESTVVFSDDEAGKVTAPPASSDSPAQPDVPVPSIPAIQPTTPPFTFDEDSRSPEKSDLFLTDEQIKKRFADSPDEIEKTIATREFYRKMMGSFNRRPSDRRCFDEVHQYPGDPSLTITFAHFANANVDSFFSRMPEGIRESVATFFSQELVKQEAYLSQFKDDYHSLFEKDPEPGGDGSWKEPLMDFLFSSKGVLDKSHYKWQKVLGTTHSTAYSLWADDRIYHYANDYPSTPFGLDVYKLISIKNEESDKATLPVGTRTFTLKQEGGVETMVEDTKENGQKGCYVQVDEILEGMYNDKRKLVENGSFHKLRIEGTDLFYHKRLVDQYGKKIDGILYVRYRVIGARLFPGVGKSGYWFNDILKYALMLREVKEWQLYHWCKQMLEGAGAVASNFDLKDHLGAIAAMMSWKSSGYDFGVKMVTRVVSGEFDSTFSFGSLENVSRLSLRSCSVSADKSGLLLACSSDLIQGDGAGRRQVVGTNVTVSARDCIQDVGGAYFVPFQSSPVLSKICRNVDTYEDVLQGIVLRENAAGSYLECSAETYKKVKKEYVEDAGGGLRKVVGSDALYVEKGHCFSFEDENAVCRYLVHKKAFKKGTKFPKTVSYLQLVGTPRVSKGTDAPYLLCSSDVFRRNSKDRIVAPTKDKPGTLRSVVGTPVYVAIEDCREIVNDQNETLSFVPWKEKAELKAVEKGVYTYGIIGCEFMDNENGPYVRVSQTRYSKKSGKSAKYVEDDTAGILRKIEGTNTYVPAGECMGDNNHGDVWGIRFLPIESRPCSEADLKALQIWLYYNIKKGKVRDRHSNIYEFWFQQSWGLIPDYVAWRDKSGYHEDKTGLKKCNVKEAFVYTGIPMERLEVCSWDIMKKCLNLTSPEIKNKGIKVADVEEDETLVAVDEDLDPETTEDQDKDPEEMDDPDAF